MMNLKAPTPILCKVCNKESAPEVITARLLTGDIFIQYTCPNCSPTKTVILERLPMNWVSIIHLVLYHLHAQDKTGTSFFRWKEDICRTIEDHWDDLCPARNPSGNWTNSISSILSANSTLFESGFAVMKQTGWWALKDRNVAPTIGEAQKRGQVTVIDEQVLQGEDGVLDVEKANSPKRKSPVRQTQGSPTKPIKSKEDLVINKEIVPKEALESPTKRKLPVEQPAPVKMSAANLPTFSTTRVAPVPPVVPPVAPVTSTAQGDSSSPTNNNNHPLRMLAAKPAGSGPDPTAAASEIKRKLVERLLRVDSELLKQALSRDTPKTSGTGAPLNPIMFVPSTQLHHQQPVKPKDPTSTTVPQPPKKKAKPAHYIRASPHENELVDLTNRVVNPDDQVLRLKRKLAVRKIKRMNGTQLFDLDNWIYLYLKAGNEPLGLLDSSAPNLLAGLRKRHHATDEDSHAYGQQAALIQAELSDVPYLKDAKLSFWAKLMGVTNLEGYPFEIESPYTGNVLPGFVHRETQKIPPRLLLLQQLRTHSEEDEDSTSSCESIDICHLRKEQVGQVNRLLRSNFWPSIDISESLEWPDYSFTLLYRNLVIGCAICSPEGYLSYIFVHPDWRRMGFASRLLYAVVRAAGRRDVTVHVAVGNQAMMMYQRFGFKPEEYIVDFYGERYKHNEEGTEPDPASRNAFFLRLRK